MDMAGDDEGVMYNEGEDKWLVVVDWDEVEERDGRETEGREKEMTSLICHSCFALLIF